MCRIIISDDDMKAIRHILILYSSNTNKYVSKLQLSKGVYCPAYTRERVEELINLFDMKGCKKLW